MSMIISPYRFAVTASGNYWNPADKASEITLSSANKTATRSSTSDNAWRLIRGLTSHSTGKHYAEVVMDVNSSVVGSMCFGIANASASLTAQLGGNANGWGIQANNSGNLSIYNNGTQTGQGSGGNAINAGGRAMVAYDAGTGKIWLGSNGAWFALGNPGAGTGANYTTTPAAVLFLALSEYNSPLACSLKNNVGENLYSIPSGFSMWG